MEKRCFKCEKTKPVLDFYKHAGMADGRLGKCIECAKIDVKKRYNTEPEKLRAYELKRNKLPARRASKKDYLKTWRKKNRDKSRAHKEIGRKTAAGKIQREPCSVCGTNKYVHAHHDDYSKPLVVLWLCAKHHKLRHKELDESNGKIEYTKRSSSP